MAVRVVFGFDGLVTPSAAASGMGAASLGAMLLGETYAAVGGAASGGGGAAASLVCLTSGASRYEVWRAAGPESEASTDLSSACDVAARIASGRDAAALQSGGSVKAKMPYHPLVGGLLGNPIGDALDGCFVLPNLASVHPTPVTMHAYERGAVLLAARGGDAAPLRRGSLAAPCRGLRARRRRGGVRGRGADAERPTPRRLPRRQAQREQRRGRRRRRRRRGRERGRAHRRPAGGERARPAPLLRRGRAALGPGLARGFLAAAPPPGGGGGGGGALTDLTLALSKPASRRQLRREVLPAWRAQWARRGTECPPEAPMPPALAALPAETIGATWPSRALKAAIRGDAGGLGAADVADAAPTATGAAPAAAAAAAVSISDGETATPAAVRVLLLLGAPSPALGEIAAGVVAVTSSSARWLRFVDGGAWCDGEGHCDVGALTEALVDLLRGAGSAGLPERVAVATHGFVEARAAAACVAAACAAASAACGGAATAALGAVAAVIDAPRAFERFAAEGDLRCTPGLVESLDDGFVQAALVCHTAELRSATREASLLRLISGASPRVSIIRATGGPRAAAAELGALLGAPTAPFASAAMARARAASDPQWAAASAASAAPPPPPPPNPALRGVRVVQVPPPPAVSPRRLASRLKELLTVAPSLPPADAPDAPHILTLFGSLPVVDDEDDEDDEEAVDVSDEAAAGKKAGGEGGGEAAPPPPSWARLDVSQAAYRQQTLLTPPARPAPLQVVCRGMGARDVARALLDCRRLPPLRPLVAKESIPRERLEALRLHLRDHVALPEGVFYDGRAYISMDGDRYDEHPSMDGAVAELLDSLNADVRAANAAVEATLAPPRRRQPRTSTALARRERARGGRGEVWGWDVRAEMATNRMDVVKGGRGRPDDGRGACVLAHTCSLYTCSLYPLAAW